MDKPSRVLKTIRYPTYGYELRRQVFRIALEGEAEEIPMTSAYTIEGGHYIGNKKLAEFLCRKRGIKPELALSSDSVCSVGFCQKEQCWYGWSHRAITSFTLGDRLYDPAWRGDDDQLTEEQMGLVHFREHGRITIETLDQARQAAVNFAREVS